MKLSQEQNKVFSAGVAGLKARGLPGGGFPGRAGGKPRPDSTAWAVAALAHLGGADARVGRGRDYLAALQDTDGRVAVSPDQKNAAWPTSLSVLAWAGSAKHAGNVKAALKFLGREKGRTPKKVLQGVVGHNRNLTGWPWIDGTHAWIEPTALAVMAFAAGGEPRAPRADQGRALILDRQLAAGGWNYGNTTVFGHQLFPMPETTGLALTALAGAVPRPRVANSLAYLAAGLPPLRSPLSLGWGVMALTAWGSRPDRAGEWLAQCLQRQELMGPFETSFLALALLAMAGVVLGSPRQKR